MSKKIPINLALQGGGSHGAFIWGVLDRLLEEENLIIEGISGTSAGAINGALLATGLVIGGRSRAKELLDIFWKEVAKSYIFNPYPDFESYTSKWESALESLNPFDPKQLYNFFMNFSTHPYIFDPLKNILDGIIDFECLRKTKEVQIFVCATNVETNRIKIFTNEDICTTSLLASSCLPTLRQAVEWQGEYYWDGGFMGNPMLEPLIYNCKSKDLLIVEVNPVFKPGVPKTYKEILDRLNEVTFNSSLMREIRSILNIQSLSENYWCNPQNPYAGLKLHTINNDAFMSSIGVNSKYNVNYEFLNFVKEKGREAASNWIIKKLKHVGTKSTMDLSKWKLETPTTTCLAWNQHKDTKND